MKFNGKYVFFTLLVIIIMIILSNDSMAQCSMCRKIATDGANSKATGASLNSGILYLLATPYLLIAFFFRKQLFDFIRGILKK